MKRRIMPVLVVILLIVLVAAAAGLTYVIRKNTPTREQMDASEYYGLSDDEIGIPLVFGTEVLSERGILHTDGDAREAYVSIDVVSSYLNKRFYWDGNDSVLMYTSPTEKYTMTADSADYMVNGRESGSEDYLIFTVSGDTPYINIRFVQKFTDIEYEVLDSPSRLVLQYEWSYTAVTVQKEDAAVRYGDDIKSEILTTVERGTSLRLIEEQEDWDLVATEDGFVGYIRKRDLTDITEDVVEERDFDEPEYTSQRRDYAINLVWHQVTSKEANQYLEDAISSVSGVNVISPTWFSIRNNKGKITNYATKGYVSKAHKNGLEVWALVDNFSEDVDTCQVLSNSESRVTLEENLIAQAVRFDLDGLNIDFETLTEETIPHFIQFLREMSILCRANGLVLSVDNPPPEDYTTYYDRSAQAEVVDYIIMMGYDEHYQGSEEAGSVASCPWVEQGVQDTLEEVPAEKLILGIPFYTRLWYTQNGLVTSEAVGMDEASEFVSAHGIETYWAENYLQNYGEYETDDGLYQVWLEDADSIAAKLQLVQEYDLAGVAAWKLGFESDDIWEVIAEGIGVQG